MTLRIAGALLGEIRFDGPGQIDPRLVGQTNQHPQHVGHFVGEVLLFARLERLVANSPTSSVRTAILVSSLK